MAKKMMALSLTLFLGVILLAQAPATLAQLDGTSGSESAPSQRAGAAAAGEWATSGSNIFNTNAGNVGVGTSIPQEKLHVQGVMRSNGVNSHAAADPNKVAFLGYNPVGGYTFLSSWDWTTSSLQKIFLNGSQVGIGTGNPTRLLDVAGTIGGLNRFQVDYPVQNVYDDSTINAPYSRVHADSFHTNGMGVGQMFIEGRAIDSNSTIFIGAGLAGGRGPRDVQIGENPEIFVDTSRNNVGIGTTNPNAAFKLAVNGTIGAKEVRVTLANWPDYVFEESYELPSLGEVEDVIQRRGHLPGIPSARQVGEEGIGLGDMQARLLQKVEELTLYVIDLKKENETLKDRLDSLEGVS